MNRAGNRCFRESPVEPYRHCLQLPGKVVLITGGSSGIGASTAHLLAKQGAHVLLVARGKDALDEQAETIRRAGGTVTTFPCDLSEVDQIVALGEAVRSSVGTPDIVVNNAGAGRFMYLDETEPSELAAMTALPYQAALLVTREFLPAMLARGSGWLVIVNSPVSRMPWPGATGYAGSRWALRGMTTALRLDLRGTGIGVSEVVPDKVAASTSPTTPAPRTGSRASPRSFPNSAPNRSPSPSATPSSRSAGRCCCPGSSRRST